MKIVFVISRMSLGGAQRVMALMANHWAEKRHSITIVEVGDSSAPSFFSVHEKVRIIPLGLKKDSLNLFSGLINNIRRVWVIRRTLQKCAPDVVLSSLDTTNIKTILAVCGLGIPIIVSEHIDPAGWNINIGRAWEFLRRLTYPWADAVVCLGTPQLSYFGPRIKRRGVIIPNPVVLPDTVLMPAESRIVREIHTLVSLGRLTSAKGFDVLLDAFERVSSHRKNWRLKIWGEGPLWKDLKAHAQRLDAADRIEFPGVTHEPYVRLSESDIFVLPSRVEGFPMVLCEAMAVGLPVIATDVAAVSDIIRNEIDGILVPPDNIDALSEAMDRLMGSHELRSRLAARAPEVLERFNIEKVMDRWEKLIRKVTGKEICEPAKD